MSALPLRAVGFVCGALVLCGTTRTEASAEARSVHVRPFMPLQTARVLAARPKECSLAFRGAAPLWQRVRQLDVEVRCARLARGLTRVTTEPQAVLDELRDVLSTTASGATQTSGPLDELTRSERAIEARAWLHLGDVATAFARFSALQAAAPVTEWHVFAVHDFAVAAVRSGRYDVAVSCYRRVAGVAPWLPWTHKVNVLIEASAALLHASSDHRAEALGYLAELDGEVVGADLRHVIAALRSAAGGESLVEPVASTGDARGWGRHTSLRLAEQDVRFVDAFVAMSRGDEGRLDGISLPAFRRVLEQLRDRR